MNKLNFKNIIINTILIFIVCSIFHFVYDLVPSFVTSIFFPVNESIWEHLKLIFTSSIVYTLISNLYYKDNNQFLIGYLRGMFTIIILLIIYLPIRKLFGEVMIVTLIILFISILLSETIVNKIIKKHYNKLNIISVFLIIINFIIFTYLTYNPIKSYLFYDTESNKYGIDILNK